MRNGFRGGAFQMGEQTALLLVSALLTLNDSQQKQLGVFFDAPDRSNSWLNSKALLPPRC